MTFKIIVFLLNFLVAIFGAAVKINVWLVALNAFIAGIELMVIVREAEKYEIEE